MDRFCKVFEVQDHQVLAIIDYDEETERHYLQLETRIEGLAASIKLEDFEGNRSSAVEALEKLDQSKAEDFFIAMNDLLLKNE